MASELRSVFVAPIPWDFAALVHERASRSADLLDLGTGGGERLSQLLPRPARTVATEGYLPNLREAYRRLPPLGIHLVRTSVAQGNADQGAHERRGSLPFRAGSFRFVTDRYEAHLPSEVARVLRSGGHFLAEMTGGEEVPELCQRLELDVTLSPSWTLEMAERELKTCGLSVERSGAATFTRTFHVAGAELWYVLSIPWVAPGFSLETRRPQLGRIHQEILREGPLRVPRSGFWLEARKR